MFPPTYLTCAYRPPPAPSRVYPSSDSAPPPPSLAPVAKILEVGALPEGQEVVAIGTLYKDMKLKPSIMDEYAKDKCVGGGEGGAGWGDWFAGG